MQIKFKLKEFEIFLQEKSRYWHFKFFKFKIILFVILILMNEFNSRV